MNQIWFWCRQVLISVPADIEYWPLANHQKKVYVLLKAKTWKESFQVPWNRTRTRMPYCLLMMLLVWLKIMTRSISYVGQLECLHWRTVGTISRLWNMRPKSMVFPWTYMLQVGKHIRRLLSQEPILPSCTITTITKASRARVCYALVWDANGNVIRTI